MYPNVEKLREAKGLTMLDIANATGIRSVTTVSLKLSGKSPITLAEAKAIKRALATDMDLEDLFKEREAE